VTDRRAGLRAFLTTPGPCPVQAAAAGGFARPCTTQRWSADGTPSGAPGAARPAPAPLRRVPAALAAGDLYIDPR
jgi:hypothetical protein